jgi:hypothetical protein
LPTRNHHRDRLREERAASDALAFLTTQMISSPTSANATHFRAADYRRQFERCCQAGACLQRFGELAIAGLVLPAFAELAATALTPAGTGFTGATYSTIVLPARGGLMTAETPSPATEFDRHNVWASAKFHRGV